MAKIYIIEILFQNVQICISPKISAFIRKMLYKYRELSLIWPLTFNHNYRIIEPIWYEPIEMFKNIIGWLRLLWPLIWTNLQRKPIQIFNLMKFLISLVGSVFANGSEDLDSIPGRLIQKTFKMVLDTSLLNTQQFKVRIKGKVEQSRERSSALPYTLV